MHKLIENIVYEVDRKIENFSFTKSILAGFYISLGFLLSANISGIIPKPYSTLAVGLTFGIGITLIVFATAELFTGNVLLFGIYMDSPVDKPYQLGKSILLCYIGNFLGALIFSTMALLSGSLNNSVVLYVSENIYKKMQYTSGQLLFKAILCNIVVCLLIWCIKRTKSDTAKILIIVWCIALFIICGFEHSIANMVLFQIGYILNLVELNSAMYNLVYVTWGNIIGGLLVAYVYTRVGRE